MKSRIVAQRPAKRNPSTPDQGANRRLGYAGQSIQVVFVYRTRDDQLGEGFAVDNVEIRASQLDFDDDGEGDACDSCTDGDGDLFGDPETSDQVCPYQVDSDWVTNNRDTNDEDPTNPFNCICSD